MLRTVPIDVAWPRIEATARALLTDPEEASADDLYNACANGDAICCEADDGIVVFTVRVNTRTDQRELLVWFCCSEHDPGAFMRTLPDVKKVGRDLRCVNIIFYSTRAGWMKLARAAGGRVRNIEFVIPIAGACH